jgi:hypothetical protein
MKSRFFWLFIAPNILFGGIALATSATALISVLNAALFAVAIGVCMAYGPPVLDTLWSGRPMDRADWLGIGIFCSWFSIVVIRAWSIAWRYLGKPEWLLESDLVSYALYLQLCAAVFHLAAPGAIGNRVPTRRWINIGTAVAVLIFAALVLGYMFDALAVD